MIRIAVTSGEPAGIGPDIVIQLAENYSEQVIILGDQQVLEQRSRLLKKTVAWWLYTPEMAWQDKPQGHLAVLDIPVHQTVTAGQLNKRNAPAVIKQLEVAAGMCLQDQCQAMVTAPVSKAVLNDGGYRFVGQTEYLAQLCQSPAVMMLSAEPNLRVALLTTHLAIRDVATAIDQQGLVETIKIVHHCMRHWFGISKPRIAVCGLNPHAGEHGYLGREEIDIIEPALNKMRQSGLRILGPLSADTAFIEQQRSLYDVIICMYHDQGLPIVKQLGFGQVVNISLGLPIIRTSVDHGTALDLAGSGPANANSLIQALELAQTIAQTVASKAIC